MTGSEERSVRLAHTNYPFKKSDDGEKGQHQRKMRL